MKARAWSDSLFVPALPLPDQQVLHSISDRLPPISRPILRLGAPMVCVEHESLRREWIAARADYQLALAELQVSTGVDEFRDALKRANQTFAELHDAERALQAHLKWHGCSRIPVFHAVASVTS